MIVMVEVYDVSTEPKDLVKTFYYNSKDPEQVRKAMGSVERSLRHNNAVVLVNKRLTEGVRNENDPG